MDFFGTMRLFLKEKKNQKFQFFPKVLSFLSLRYGADFRRSRLVLKTPLDTGPDLMSETHLFENYIGFRAWKTVVSNKRSDSVLEKKIEEAKL